MPTLYAFGSNLHDSFGLGDDCLEVNSPTKLAQPTLIQANWSQAVYRSAAGVLAYGGLNLAKLAAAASLWTDHVLLGQNEWVAAHSNSTKRITRLEDGAISTSTFDHVAINGVGEVLTAEYAPNLVLHLFPTLSAALAHSSELSPSSLPLAFPLPPPSATHPLALHPGLSHFLLHAPPHHLLALSDNRFSQSSTHASPLPGLPPTPVPELEGMEPIACAAGGRHSAAVSAGGEVWAWGSGTGEKGKVVLEDHDEVEVRGVSCGQEHTVLWTDEGVWAAGANNFGQLGLGDTKPRERFTRLSALDGCGPVERVVCTRWATFVQCA